MSKYEIEVTEKQLRLIARAVEFYSRMNSGQFTEIKDLPIVQNSKTGGDVWREIDRFKALVTTLRVGESIGVGMGDDEFEAKEVINESYEIYRNIWYYLQVGGVLNSKPLKYTKEPLIKITKDK